jgi:hypothetical protein
VRKIGTRTETGNGNTATTIKMTMTTTTRDTNPPLLHPNRATMIAMTEKIDIDATTSRHLLNMIRIRGIGRAAPGAVDGKRASHRTVPRMMRICGLKKTSPS